jgi:hypothetical protein
MENKRNSNTLLVGKPERKITLGRFNVGGMIIFKWILEK